MPNLADMTGEELDAFDRQVYGDKNGPGASPVTSEADLPADGSVVDRGTGKSGRVSLNEMRLGYGELEMKPTEAVLKARAALGQGYE
jgi:hypothetical protein